MLPNTEEPQDDLPPDPNNQALRQPLLGEGQQHEPQNGDGNALINIVDPIFGPMMTEKWFQDIYTLAELPTPYDYKSCKENMLSAIALGCALCSVILYVLGGSKDGAIYIVGGVAVNLLQTFFFTKETINFFSKVHDKKQLAAISMFFAVFSTTVVAFATYQMSEDAALAAAIESVMVFAGNLPQNLYGMFESIQRVLDSHRDKPMAREFLLVELKKIVDGEASLKNTVPLPRGTVHKAANQVVGAGIGVFLSLSQVGYIRSSVNFINKHVISNDATALTFGVLTNLPGLCISMFISGKNLTEKIIDSAVDTGRWMYNKAVGNEVSPSTSREMFFFGGKLISATIFAGFSYFSASTSVHLYKDDPSLPYLPTIPEFDNFIRAAVNQGCQVFNGVMAIMGSDKIFDFVNQAYVEKPSFDEVKLKVKAMVHVVTGGDIAKVLPIAIKAGFDPMKAPEGCSLFGSRTTAAAVASAANDPNGYRAIPNGVEIDHDANMVFGRQ